MTPEGAYLLRRHPDAASFRKAWEAALSLGVQQLEDIAMERALYGQEVPVYSYGKLIGSRIVHNDRLLMFMLKNRAPTRFAADGRATARRNTIGDPHYAAQLSRLKKQWHKEWEEERRLKSEKRGEEVVQSINAKLERMRQNRLAAMSPATRNAHDEYERLQQQDRDRGYHPALIGPEEDGGEGEDY